jgi:rod shape-determining protein MreD
VRLLWFPALALLLLSVESVLVKAFGLDVARIDVGLAIVVFAAVRAGTVEGAFSAFALGYLLDVYTGRPTGLFPFLSVLVFLLVRATAQVVDGRTRGAYALLVAGATVLHALLAVFFSWLTSSSGDGRVLSLAGVPLQVFLSVGAGQLLWPLLKRIEPGDRPEATVGLR